MKKIKRFSDYMEHLGHRHDLHRVFTDTLELIVCALSLGAKEERYLEIIGRYNKSEAHDLAAAFAALVIEMDNDGQGLKDCFGDFFMEYLSHGRNGQFFTPEPICDMMARMTNPSGIGERIADCCCGSGRMLMAAARVNRNALFYGADVDRTCCLMCLINMCLNGMLGEVSWMNSLSNQFFGGWCVELHPEHYVPYIREITEAESYIVLKLPMHKPELVAPKNDLVSPKPEPASAPQQQLLFEF